MKNKLKNFFILAFALALVLSCSTFLFLLRAETDVGETGAAPWERQNYLLLGLDEAAKNTDVILLTSLTDAGMEMLQIPRDTYVRCEFFEGKINQMYNKMLSRKKEGAEEQVTKLFAELLGIPVDGYIILNLNAVCGLVDALGGVPMAFEREIQYTDEKNGTVRLPVGHHVLNGREAVGFVRYRAGYANGDLGRLDAQMQFFGALFQALKAKHSLPEYVAIYQKIAPNLLTNLTEKDIIKVIVGFIRERANYKMLLMRLPGEPTRDRRGVSYYVLHQKTAARMLKEHFGGSGTFDTQEHFTTEREESFMNIFTVKPYRYRVYTFDDGGKPTAV